MKFIATAAVIAVVGNGEIFTSLTHFEEKDARAGLAGLAGLDLGSLGKAFDAVKCARELDCGRCRYYGCSFCNLTGVRTVLDGILKYLPDAVEQLTPTTYSESGTLCGNSTYLTQPCETLAELLQSFGYVEFNACPPAAGSVGAITTTGMAIAASAAIYLTIN